ncbi:hypothetical protein GYMLUDRAFT_969279 [Collybiopsis luxurians FD-317 M1]|uniref:Uncharacterized protein n=1 Tax=Collybiopsis luxurians FD-317 M1 TaxID=944289 RepID=A0A0D0BRW8_9AGAR|nr:hypothetical protein GYMLUDRAFT_969279 [Collybiopsis luxurians FD-317 M1]
MHHAFLPFLSLRLPISMTLFSPYFELSNLPKFFYMSTNFLPSPRAKDFFTPMSVSQVQKRSIYISISVAHLECSPFFLSGLQY